METETFDWKYFKKYVNTYDPKKHADNNVNCIMHDMLYGLGVSIADKKYKMADGYARFKKRIVSELNKPEVKITW